MDKKCSIAVIGVGQRGYSYVEMIKGHPALHLAGLCDISKERLETFAAELGCSQVPQFYSVEDLLANCQFDAAVITTPDFAHCECAVACFRSGKHVMLEKPMAPTAAECHLILEESRKNDRVLEIGFVLRCLPLYLEVKKLLEAGTIGQLLSLSFTEAVGTMHGASYMRRWHRKSANSGGFLLAKCSHDLDLMNQLAGSLPVKVASFGGCDFFTPDKKKTDFCSRCQDQECRFRFEGEMVRMTPQEQKEPSKKPFDLCVYNSDKDVVDNQQVIMEYANGVRGSFNLTLFAPVPGRKWEFAGTNGYISVDTSSKKLTVSFSDGREGWSKICDAANGSAHDGSDRLFLDEFVSCILEGKKPSADARAGLAATVIANAAEKSRLESVVVDIPLSEYE